VACHVWVDFVVVVVLIFCACWCIWSCVVRAIFELFDPIVVVQVFFQVFLLDDGCCC